MKQLLDKEAHLEWFSGFFGDRPGSKFTVALGLLNGPNNYGPHVRRPTAGRNSTASWAPGRRTSKGEPTFGGGVLETVVHEFCHSYTNPIVDRHEAELKSAGEALYKPVASASVGEFPSGIRRPEPGSDGLSAKGRSWPGRPWTNSPRKTFLLYPRDGDSGGILGEKGQKCRMIVGTGPFSPNSRDPA